LRRHFEINAGQIAAAVLAALARAGDLPASRAEAALAELGVSPEHPDPLTA
jgi:pyruvate dehydrogenase complex dehydrogenase (E1) component